jgi:cleavage stimulation factor subunit 3
LFRPAVGQYAENQRISAIRKVYQRGVVVPMVNVEGLWNDYCIFERVSIFANSVFNLDLGHQPESVRKADQRPQQRPSECAKSGTLA